jgi:phosphomannomutase
MQDNKKEIEALRNRTQQWIEDDPDAHTAAELGELLVAQDEASLRELAERMAGPLQFGTAGLRGIYGAGESRMNRAVIRRTTAGLAAYLLQVNDQAAQAGVVIGYDGRQGSRQFAEDTAGVLAGAGIRALLMTEVAPTPFVAFGVLHFSAAAGIMVTASHNPPEYNGYKLYWKNGAQIVPPQDEEIAAAMARVGAARDVTCLNLAAAEEKQLLQTLDVGELTEQYLAAAQTLSVDSRGRDSQSIVHTALHGVGEPFTRQLLERFGFSRFWSVPEQSQPDPAFPTVPFPNPEEKGALDLVLDLAARQRATLVLANDPDADRLAVAVPWPDGRGTTEYRQLTGNEVGLLLGDYLLRRAPRDGTQPIVVTTIVSSPALGHVARAQGALFAEVLTGFKWIANRAMELETAGQGRFLFGYEEALGYTVGRVARDKDGVSGAAVFAELVAVAAAEGRTLVDELERIARHHGLYVSQQRSIVKTGKAGAAAIQAMMAGLRSNPPTRVGTARVMAVRDFWTGTHHGDDVVTPLEFPQSNVMALDLEGNARIVARPSGTEPKIKFYFDVGEPVAKDEDYFVARARAEARLEGLAQEFLATMTGSV